MKDPTQKAHFYRNTLKEALPFIPKDRSLLTKFDKIGPKAVKPSFAYGIP
ncbi:hypothetical protein NQ317_013706 [Molorchus minor]|uniref:Uncharacterized protein n=1 Tax=Molorchus minor TaxID=1323400 RepID=A0ABQ9JER9_9CUCU|nr:hypothetical protein NQ317_013706 [Molorchus minor]